MGGAEKIGEFCAEVRPVGFGHGEEAVEDIGQQAGIIGGDGFLMEDGIIERQCFLPAHLFPPADQIEHSTIGRAFTHPLAQMIAHHRVAEAETPAGFGDIALGEDRAEDFEGGRIHFLRELEQAVGQHFFEALLGGAQFDEVVADGGDFPMDVQQRATVVAQARSASGPSVEDGGEQG